ncbi:MAG: glycosyltransferase [Terrimicrobiaceae bacterium]|nr:glycosyltransferase [Terrimicrobiaceae bacterium]
MDPWVLLSGGYPPMRDGIGDHTRRLAREMAKSVPVEVWTARLPGRAPDDGFPVREVFDPLRPSSIRQIGRGKVLVQYNPFGFGPRGFNPWLAGALSGSEVSVMFHETMVPPEGWKFRLMRIYQKAQFRALVGRAKRIFVSTGRWADEVRRVRRDANVTLLPVGSNIDRTLLTRAEARQRMGFRQDQVVVGVFGSAHPSRLLEWIAAGFARIRAASPDAALVYVGVDGARLRQVCGDGVVDCGVLAESEVGDRLIAWDVMLAPFVDGLSTRRGSVVAAFQHGVPVVSTSRDWTDGILRGREGIELVPVEAGATVFAERCLSCPRAPRESLEIFYREVFDWPVAARTILNV